MVTPNDTAVSTYVLYLKMMDLRQRLLGAPVDRIVLLKPIDRMQDFHIG